MGFGIHMKIDMYQLAYLSHRRSDVTDEQIVDGIVLPALTKNRSLGVTGCLWFDQDHFFQVLEGSQDTIESLYSVIASDDRHDQVKIILTEDIGSVRRFERFGMRAAHSGAARSMPMLIDACGAPSTSKHEQASRSWKWFTRRPKAEGGSDPEGPGETSLARTVIDQLANWSDSTPT